MVLEYSSFSTCGHFYAHCGSDSKLKIWETGTGNLKQEYTPNLHLTSPYTCLTWISSLNVATHPKKKRKSDGEGGLPLLVLGTQAGAVVVYSVAEGGIVSSLNDGHKSAVQCLAWESGADLFTCSTDNFVHWDVKNKTVRRKWRNGEACSAMAVSPDGEMLITASRSIKWWSVEKRTVIRTFTGHATPVIRLAFLTSLSGDNYVISAAQKDRLVNAWSLNENADNNAVSSFLLSDLVQNVSVNVSKDGVTNLVVVTQSGTLHLFSHQLNGKCGKPLKPTLTVMVAFDTGQSKTRVPPLTILGAHLYSQLRALIVYGQSPFLAFESIKLEHTSNELCLVRKDPKKSTSSVQQEVANKVRAPEVSKDVQYLTGTVVNGSLAPKRGRGKESEVPMEERLENLALNQPSSSSTQPKTEGMAHLLIQGLQSKDKSLLQNVLFRRDEAAITQTVQRLPVQVIGLLVKELSVLLQGKTFTNQVAAVWLKALLATHSGQLLADPSATAAFSPLLGLVETRVNCLAPLGRLRGRLDLMLHQVSGSERQSGLVDTQALVVHQDGDSTEEGSDTLGSEAEDDESEDRWDELSEDEVENMESEDVDET
ncbi:WD repeat-containing protein 43 isoform X1 [Homalodisca vitripennis]|uniref:WD repeat-containing protein 43 isoform X1 n=1 Tax=Homalodisca vitripennis TaxID=197043 RepID=UPI001EEB0A64|nr:WD repeat-containing protein 43 isoform X1 [Homalodisca vitripennis]